MKKLKNVIKKISIGILLFSIILTSSGCSSAEIGLSSVSILNSGFKFDTDGKGTRLQQDIENKFKFYEDVLNKLGTMGVLKNKDLYLKAMVENKEYLEKMLITDRKMDEDISSAIAWIMDPQYICRLYNDLSWIKQYWEEMSLMSMGNYDFKEVWGYYSSNSDAEDVEDIGVDDDFFVDEDENQELLDEILEEEESYYEEVISPIAGANPYESGGTSGSIESIAYTLSVLDYMNDDFDLQEVKNKATKGNFFTDIFNWFTGFLGGGTKIHPFLIYETGTIWNNQFTNIAGGATDISGISVGSDGLMEGGPKISQIEDSKIQNKINALYTNEEDFFPQNYYTQDKSYNKGFSIKINYAETTEDGEIDNFDTRAANTNSMFYNVMKYYLRKSNGGGRHAVGHVLSNVSVDTVYKSDGTEVTTYTYSCDFSVATTRAIFLNIKDLAGPLLGNQSVNNVPIQSVYKMASAAITNSGRTLVDIPYVVTTDEDYDSYRTLNKVVQNNNSNIKGRNVCAPSNEQNDYYNSNVNVPVRGFQYMTSAGDYNIDYFREIVKNYDSQTEDVKKKRGDEIYNYTKPIPGNEGYIYNNNNVFATTNYKRHVDNLSYKNVLKSVAFGNAGKGAIDYNPANEIGNDLIVTIANVPAFAIRLLEFNEFADIDQADSIQKAVEEGYVMITSKAQGLFAFDPRCQIDVMNTIDATTNKVYFQSSNNFYNFLTNHFYKADPDNPTVPTDGIATSDRDLISAKFSKNKSFEHYFGPSKVGHLMLLGYDTLYYDENDEVIPGNWFPIGRTLFLNRNDNWSINLKEISGEDADIIMTIINANEPIGYLGNSSHNLYNKGSGTPIYMNDLMTIDCIDLCGEDVVLDSMFDEDYELDETRRLESNKKDNSSKFKKSTKNAPEGTFETDGEDYYYLITTPPSDTSNLTEYNGSYYLTEGYWYIPSTDGPDGEQRYYLYYVSANGWITNPPDDEYYCADEYHHKVISDKYPDGFFKPYKNKVDKGKGEIDRIKQLTNYASYIKGEFGNVYDAEHQNFPFDCPVVGRLNIRRDCSSYASLLSLKLDEILKFNGMHLVDDNGNIYSTVAFDNLTRTNDTNYNSKTVSGVSKSNITSILKPGDYLYFTREEEGTSLGHVIFVSAVSNNEITIYQWTSARAKGGPYKIPVCETDNRSASEGCCIPLGNGFKIRTPDPGSNPSLNNIYTYRHIIRSKS